MGLSGPVPLADYQRRAHGNTRPSEQKDHRRTKAAVKAPTRPQWLKGHSRNCWERTVPLLEAMNLLAKCDRNILERYCVTYGIWRPIAEQFTDGDKTYTDKDGKERKHPLFQQYRDLSAELLRMENELGLTPKARMRVAPMGDDDEQPDDGDLD